LNRFVMAVLIASTGAAVVLTVWLLRALRRVTPEEKERRRRTVVNAQGRLGAAVIVDVGDGVIVYSYSVAGVRYAATQDVSALRALLPDSPQRLVGHPAALKYLARSPENSIVVCEEWSGVQGPSEGAENT
jgi:hypothetical protein